MFDNCLKQIMQSQRNYHRKRPTEKFSKANIGIQITDHR